MNELTTEMKVSNQNHAHLKEDIDRISGITERNSKKIAEIDKDLAIVGTTQSGILGVGGKVLPFVFAGLGVLITALLSVSIYFKLSLGV
jgi:hypothetical protein